MMNTQMWRGARGRMLILLVTILVLVAGLFGLARPAGANSVPVGILFQNDMSGEVVCYLYVKPASQYVWGPDRLGDIVLLPGENIQIALLPGRYDTQVVGCDGNVLDESYNLEVTFRVPLSVSDWGIGVG